MTIPADTRRRLLFILHRARVEARLLAQAGKMQQVHDLADALEPLPAWLASWKDEYLEATRLNLKTYTARYPGRLRLPRLHRQARSAGQLLIEALAPAYQFGPHSRPCTVTSSCGPPGTSAGRRARRRGRGCGGRRARRRRSAAGGDRRTGA